MYAIPPWLWATHTSMLIGGTRLRLSTWRIRIFPTTGPLPWVMTSSLSARMMGSSARPVRAA